jgi:hypothetical protein
MKAEGPVSHLQERRQEHIFCLYPAIFGLNRETTSVGVDFSRNKKIWLSVSILHLTCVPFGNVSVHLTQLDNLKKGE